MNREYHRWHSHRLGRDMELLIFGHAGRPVLFFPPRMGRFFDYENWGIVHALADRIDRGEIQLFCVDSIDTETFYNNWAHPGGKIHRHLQYEQYIIHEVLPLIHRTNANPDIAVAGCSLGAYHATNIALKYPHLFKKLISMSGRFDLTRPVLFFRDLLDGFHNDDIYFNMPRQYMANIADGQHLDQIKQMDIVMTIGETDPFLQDNYEFSEILGWKGMQHQFYKWNGYAHSPKSWRKMVQLYL